MLKCPFCYKKSQNLQPRLNAPKIDSSLVNFCKTMFVTLACFFFVVVVIPIFLLNLFSCCS